MTITPHLTPAGLSAGASGLAVIVGDITYVRGLARKGKQSNRISWVIFELVYGVTTAALAARHSGQALVLPITALAGVSVILAVSLLLPGNGTGRLDRRSGALIGGCALAMAAWWFTRDPGVAVALAVTVELAGAALTAIDEYRNPASRPDPGSG